MPDAQDTEAMTVDAYDLLGGATVLKTPKRNDLQMHDMLSRGLPTSALFYLTRKSKQRRSADTVCLIEDREILVLDLTKAVGISKRSWQRLEKAPPTKVLSPELSSRTWRFAEILAQAMRVLGSRAEAEAWMKRPAYGLENRKPIELLTTSAGAEAVRTYLTRLEYGVYC